MVKINILELEAEKSRTIEAYSKNFREQDPCNTIERFFPIVDGEGSAISQGGPWTPDSNPKR